MTDTLFLAAKRTEWSRLIEDCAEARRRGFRQRSAQIQRRIDALALEILEAEMAEAA